ncbi:hypothetical protein BDF14DRAFT_1770481 [Spinellus fusiger]|nr:hypothetical protein BDF14DRAFT_1770481 [Spinellus fusiger]
MNNKCIIQFQTHFLFMSMQIDRYINGNKNECILSTEKIKQGLLIYSYISVSKWFLLKDFLFRGKKRLIKYKIKRELG